MTEFKQGDRIRAVRDTTSKYGTPIPKDATGTVVESPYADLAFRPDDGSLGKRRHVPPEDFEHVNHGTGDGSASDICAEPGCNCDLERRFPAPVVDDLWDAKDRVQREVAAEVFTAPAPIDLVKPGDTVTLEQDGGKYEGAVAALTTDGMGRRMWVVMGGIQFHMEGPDAWTLTAHQPAPEPEPEWKPGTVADITVHPSGVLRAVRARTGDYWAADTEEVYSDDEVEAVRPLVVIDPAEVDVDDLVAVTYRSGADTRHLVVIAVLEHLGLSR